MSAPRLQWKAPDGRDQVFLLSAPEVLIGRTREADLVLSGRHVSRHHAKLVTVPDGHEVVDLGSTYGTYVNNQRVERRVLRHGDTISFGRDDAELRYLIAAAQAAAHRDGDTTQIVQKSVQDLGRVLPSAASDLEKILCILDFQHQWNQIFTPESGLEHILESAVKISGAERAFIMTRQDGDFGYAAGLDGRGRRLSESEFHTSRTVVRKVVSTGAPVFMVEGLQPDLAAEASIVACMPLRGIPTGGDAPEILGILYLDSTKSMHSLSGLDQKILAKLAVEAEGVLERVEMFKSIEQRKKLEQDLALAEETQRSLLPQELPRLDHLQIHAFSRPTRYVGGDFYHFQVTDSGALIGVLADVSGKGVAASLLSSMLLGCIQLLLGEDQALEQALDRLNQFFCERASGRFATMFVFAVHPDGSGAYVSAGHNSAYLYRAATGGIEELESNSMIVGAFDFATFESSPFQLNPGDVLMAYSDGLTEAESASGEMFGERRLKGIVRESASAGGGELLDEVIAKIGEFTRGRTQTDDITIMIAARPRRRKETV